ncbi:MAG: hypothetical protein ACYTFI_09005 [Planctomycetota bacterium]|jgi:hypothetical protein
MQQEEIACFCLPMAKQVRRRLLLVLLSIVVLVSLWFLGVHRVRIMESCEFCWYGYYYEEYRVFGRTVKTKTLDSGTDSLMNRIFMDLGVVCPHPGLHASTEVRWWGLVLAWPDHRGASYGVGGPAPVWYDAKGGETIRRMVELDPQLPETIRKRIIEGKDLEYQYSFIRHLMKMAGVGGEDADGDQADDARVPDKPRMPDD